VTNNRNENVQDKLSDLPDDEPEREFRIGVMCNGMSLEEWQVSCLENLLKIDGARLELLIIDDGTWTSPMSLKKNPFSRWLYILFRGQWFKHKPRRHVDIDKLFSGVSKLKPQVTLKGKFSQYFDKNSLDVIESHNLDFILRFGFNILRGDILTVAK